MIQSVEQKGSMVFVRNEHNKVIATIPLNRGELLNYTSNSVSIKRGNMLFIYNEKGAVKTSQQITK